MKKLCLLLCLTSFADGRFTSPHLQRASITAAHVDVMSDGYSSVLRLRGGESEQRNGSGKRRKKRHRTSKSESAENIQAQKNVDMSTDETASADDDSANGTKKRRRRRDFMSNMFKGKSEKISPASANADISSTDVTKHEGKKKKRKKRTSNKIEPRDDDNVDKSFRSDSVTNESPEKKRKRRMKRKLDDTTSEPETESPKLTEVQVLDESDLTNPDVDQVEDNKSSTEKKKKKRRKKRPVDANVSEQDDEEPSSRDAPEDHESGLDLTAESVEVIETESISSAVDSSVVSDEPSKKKRKRKKKKSQSQSDVLGDVGTEAVSDDGAVGASKDEETDEGVDKHVELEESLIAEDTIIEAEEAMLPSETVLAEQTSLPNEEDVPAIVSIDATIEIPDEEVVPESIFSSVKVDASVATVDDEMPQIESDEKPQNLPVVLDRSVEDTELETAVSIAEEIDNVEKPVGEDSPEAGEPSESFSECDQPSDNMPSETVSIEATVQIPDEEVVEVPESVFATIEADESVYDAEIKDEDTVTVSADTSVALTENEIEEQESNDNLDVQLDKGHDEVKDKTASVCEGEDEAINTESTDQQENTDVEEAEIEQSADEDNISPDLDGQEDSGTDLLADQAITEHLPESQTFASSDETEGQVETNDLICDNKALDATPDEVTAEKPVDVAYPVKLESSKEAYAAQKDSLTLSVVTWNLGEAAPSEKEASFIRQFRKGSDLVMIGAQECEDIKPRRSEGHRSRHLRRIGVQMLGEQYVPIAIHSLGGIQMALYCRREKLDDVEFIGLADVTCGVGNVFHNKGAIGVYLKLKHHESNSDSARSSKLLLVTGHLAAHVKNVDARNDDFRRIMTELELQAPARFLRPKKNRDGSPMQGDGTYLLNSMDHVIFSGDLNYRVDLPREYVDRCIDDINACQSAEEPDAKQRDAIMNKLLRRDQLLRTISSGRAFTNFNEGKIAFLPTFKFDKGSPDYDTSYKQRIPAWTDRILFKSKSIRVLDYDSVPRAMHSDHRPVYGTFSLGWGNTSSSKEKNLRRKNRR